MSKTPKRSRKSAPKPQPEKKEHLSEEQLDKVSGGIIINGIRPGITQVREAALDGGLGGPDTKLGPQPQLSPLPHLTTPKIGQ